MHQYIETNACGIIGHIEKMNGKGTSVLLYINELDRNGQQIGSQSIYIQLFNDAERVLLRNNAAVGDTLIIRNGILKLAHKTPQGQEVLTSIRCNWYTQISVIAKSNFYTLVGRNHASVA